MTEQVGLRCVAALPCNRKGQILLQQRDNKPGLPFAGYWTTFGGAIEDGETPDEAMRRELLEEIELELPLKLWKVFEHLQRNGQLVVEQYVYVGWIDRAAEDIKLNEGQALGYFGLDDMDKLPIAFGFETLFREFFAVWDTLLL
jgi:8-oxo-dGTP diphosphatase